MQRRSQKESTPVFQIATEVKKRAIIGVNRAFRKTHCPDDIPQPPKGWAYVGQGVSGMPLFKDVVAAIRFVPKGAAKTSGAYIDYNDRNEEGTWSPTRYRGIIPCAHYAIPQEAWELLDWANAKDPANAKTKRR